MQNSLKMASHVVERELDMKIIMCINDGCNMNNKDFISWDEARRNFKLESQDVNNWEILHWQYHG